MIAFFFIIWVVSSIIIMIMLLSLEEKFFWNIFYPAFIVWLLYSCFFITYRLIYHNDYNKQTNIHLEIKEYKGTKNE